jgi:hypothetical protein
MEGVVGRGRKTHHITQDVDQLGVRIVVRNVVAVARPVVRLPSVFRMTVALQWDRDSVGSHPCADDKRRYPAAAPPRESAGEDSEVKDEESELC